MILGIYDTFLNSNRIPGCSEYFWKMGRKKRSSKIQVKFSKQFHLSKTLKRKKFLFCTCHNGMFQIKLLEINPIHFLKSEEPESKTTPFLWGSVRPQLKNLLFTSSALTELLAHAWKRCWTIEEEITWERC